MKKIYKKLFLLSIISILFSTSSFATAPISGTVTYHDKFGVENIQLYLYDVNNIIVDSSTTNSQGFYILNQVPSFGEYTLRGNTDQISTGVDLEDAFMIEQYLLGYDTLTDFQYFTADVDGDGVVSWNDYYAITDWWLTYGIPFPVGEWKFQGIKIMFYTASDGQNNDAKVTSTGDVDGGGLPDKLTPANINSLNFEQIVVNETTIFEVPVYIENYVNIHGFHLSINYDSDKLEILDVQNLNEKGIYHAANGNLKITCMNNDDPSIPLEAHTAVATLKVKLRETDQKSDIITLKLADSPQFIDKNGELLKNVEISIPKIKVISENFDIINTYPNPFVTNVNFEYYLPDAGYVTVGVYNASGQLINTPTKEYHDAGIHQYLFDGTNLPKGMYLYRIIYSGTNNKEYLMTRSMIKSN